MKISFKSLAHARLALICATALSIHCLAQDKKADPNGTWKVKYEGQNGEARETVMKLKFADGKLSGTVTGRQGGETEISNAKVDGDKLSFKVTRDFNGNSVTLDYSATIAGDAIKGKFGGKFGDNEFSRDFEGKRESGGTGGADAPKGASVAGTWKWSLEVNNNTINNVLKLTQDGEKVAGTLTANDRESKVEEGKIQNGEITFQTTRERNGDKFVIKYKGKVDADEIKGKAVANIGGDDREFDWNPKRSKD